MDNYGNNYFHVITILFGCIRMGHDFHENNKECILMLVYVICLYYHVYVLFYYSLIIVYVQYNSVK